MKALHVMFCDLYLEGTETVILQGNALKAYLKAPCKSDFLENLETVTFRNVRILMESEVNS